MSEYILRRAHPSDSISLVALAIKAIPGYPFESVYEPDSISQAILGGEHRIVAENPEIGIIGTAVLGLEKMAEVKRVSVDPIMRRNGVARTMTKLLVDEACQMGLHPWADVRADQIGMQRSALTAGLIPISLEQSKHVVYNHLDQNGLDAGPARETMIHMTSLTLDQVCLYQELRQWPIDLINVLISNMQKAYLPEVKNSQLCKKRLTSAKAVKETIQKRILGNLKAISVEDLNDDISIISMESSQMLIIKPDASAFMLSEPDRQLGLLISLAKDIGLQIVTNYSNITDLLNIKWLLEADFQPTMIRPWVIDQRSLGKWQVGWKRLMNDYEQSLHTVLLDHQVEKQLKGFYFDLINNLF